MTDLTELLADCNSRGIVLQAHRDSLVIDAPERELSAELLTTFQKNKAAILALIDHRDDESPAGFAEVDAANSSVGVATSPTTNTPVEVGTIRCWPPQVPYAILAKPVPNCRRCGTQRVVPGQPGNAVALCYYCWFRFGRMESE